MPGILYYTIFFAVIGAIGMAVANRKVPTSVRKQRWLKYFMYILITGTVIASIVLYYFSWIAAIIVAISLLELIKVSFQYTGNSRHIIAAGIIVFLLAATGFILYALKFPVSFLLYIYFQVLIFDSFCQVTGQLWGKTPLWTAVSPAKTREGLIGGWICCVIAGGLVTYNENFPVYARIYTALLFGTLTALFSFCGDMSASYYKRKMHVKDYSGWLPGQGGFLDRFDSLLFTGGFYYIFYTLIFKK